MANRFILNERSYHGKGAIQEIAGEVTSRGLKKALLCTDPDLLKFGVTKKVTDVLDAAGLAYQVYSEIKPNPTIENVKDGVEAAKAAQADYIIAIGGGSSMDTAKAIGIIVTNPEFADVRSLEGTADTKNPCLPIIAVPTTAGTAAEVTILSLIHISPAFPSGCLGWGCWCTPGSAWPTCAPAARTSTGKGTGWGRSPGSPCSPACSSR